MREVVIIDGIRSAVGKRNGSLRNTRPDDLAGAVIKSLVEKTGLNPTLVDDVILGCVSQIGEQTGDIARVAALISGLPITVPGTTIDRQCGSSQQAVHFAAQAISSGDMDIVIAGGVESMSRIPIGSSYQGVKPSEQLTKQYEIIHQGLSAERIAEKYQFTRAQLDEYAYHSQEKALLAQAENRFKNEIMPLELVDDSGATFNFDQDEGPRKGTSIEKLGGLKPSFKENGIIHAGNASQISDGAGALLIMSGEKARELGLKPRFKIITRVVIGSDPTLMLTGPIAATEKALHKSGLTLADMDVFEVNEAFASVPLAWLKETGANANKLNPNGGAIALGHPLGASGARLLLTMMSELDRTEGRYGLQTMCEGMGMANATIIEKIF
ncbi:thiolase family protein [Cytobacillus sp. FSL W7-1323]|uniref:Acetyl-CoA acetyltransferase n=1 Tax=Cytobacillus kochii TaxID=859143 RepID=A0A248TML1_9BACI|nr:MULTISPECIES: thiolase family protein [Cytobacillus]ASV69453.1 acetyl-CoA acetyltransferase [Cytobacillus kochii]MDQ0184212.1 acetyl-CoA acetyltransferase family protein [Cytobacillus kochii]MEA1852611.1 thiolase family protein [Cytobacillus sp. OWB-43]